MAKQTINIGSTPNDGTGDPLRQAFDKTNENFTELYDTVATLQDADSDLSAIAALSGTSGFLKKVGTNTWSLDTNTYTDNTGTVTSVSGTGTVSGLTLSGTVTSSGSLTLGGTLTLSNTNITTALGYTPYDSSNPNGYISSANLTGISGNTVYIQGVDTAQNTRMSIIEGVDASQNTNITNVDTKAQAAFDKANSANILAQAAFAAANSGGGGTSSNIDQYARDTANTTTTNITILQGVDTTQNTRLTVVENAYTDQNNRIGIIEGVNTTQNTRMSIIEGVDTWQNTQITNTSTNITYLQGALDTANSNIVAAAQTVPQNAQTTNYALQLTDAGKHIYYTQSSGTALFIPDNGQSAFNIGTTIMIISQTSSNASITVTPNTGVTLYYAGNTTSSSRIISTYGMATLIKVSANTWFINGTGII